MPIRAAIFGLSGPSLSREEQQFFADVEPLGFILFSRNCISPDQLRRLTNSLRTLTGRPGTPILIDQEGGRVTRLGPPHWRKPPAAERLSACWSRQPDVARAAVAANARLIADDLHHAGINVDCAPVLDVPALGAHDIIGDRAFGPDVPPIVDLGRAMAEALIAGGVLPVMKHIPGHGRARADSHKELPVVEANRDELEAVDFATFAALKTIPLAMTAHVLYTAIDPHRAATTSALAIDVIRRQIGFDELLMSDDISSNMKALPGDYDRRTKDCLVAGCDVVLHCSGRLGEMEMVASALPELTPAASSRWARAQALLPKGVSAADRPALEAVVHRALER